MPIRFEKEWFTIEMCRANPDALFVFGDNLEAVGKGGQAIIRDEPNAIGIPTKRAPSMHEGAFFTDKDLGQFTVACSEPMERLVDHLAGRGIVVLPFDGLGTGRAQLEKRAPLVWKQLQTYIKLLEWEGRR